MGLPSSGSKRLFDVSIVLLIFSIIFFSLRMYVRLTRKAWGYDDWILLIGFPIFLWFVQTCISGALHGVGTHQVDLSPTQIQACLKDFWLLLVSTCAATLFVKMSIVVTLFRIAGNRIIYRRILYIISGSCITTLVAIFIYAFVKCTPIAFAWDQTIEGGSCLPQVGLTIISFIYSGVNIITDWVCALMPIPLLYGLHMRKNAKIAAAGLLGMGIFASVCALVRLAYTVNLMRAVDYTYGIQPTFLWTLCEVSLGLIATCGSTLRPIFSRLLHLDTTENSTADALNTHQAKRSRVGNDYELNTSSRKGTFNTTTVMGGHIQVSKDRNNVSDNDSEVEILPGKIHVQHSITRE